MAFSPNGSNPVFDLQRKRINQQAEAQGQQENDAIQRRYAAMGGLNSGSYVKAQQQQADSAMARRQQALEGVDMSEAQDAARRAEVEAGRQFQREERLGSQDFGAGQAALQRQFATSERLGGQDFASAQNLAQRDFAAAQNRAQQDFQAHENGLNRDLQKWQFDLSNNNQIRALDLEAEKFGEDKKINDWNRRMYEQGLADDAKQKEHEKTGAEVGFLAGGPVGALAGFGLGSLF